MQKELGLAPSSFFVVFLWLYKMTRKCFSCIIKHIRNKKMIYFVRHGQTEWNKIGKMQGHKDIELNAEGKAHLAL